MLRHHGPGHPVLTKDLSDGYSEHPGWYEDSKEVDYRWKMITISNTMGFDRYHAIFDEAVQWLYDTLDNCEEHCRWVRVNDCQYFYFQRKEDATLFALKWSQPDQ